MKFLGIRKRSWKKILMVGLSVLLVVGAVAGCVALFGNTKKEISPMKFSRGDIDQNGKFVDSSLSICTKDAFLCQGLRIVPDFDANGEFVVHYYDVNGRWLASSDRCTATYEGNVPAATYARVVYYPECPADEDAKDWSIGLFEVTTYAKQLTITVNKEQVEYKSSTDLYVEADKQGAFTVTDITELTTNVTHQASAIITLDGTYDLYMVYVKVSEATKIDTDVAFGYGEDTKSAIRLDEKGKNEAGFAYTFEADAMIADCWYSAVVEVPHDATALRIQGPVGAEYQIYGVEPK